jgi:hypothetical protein
MQNAARLDADMARMLQGISVGLVPETEQVAELVKKISVSP